MAKPSEALVFTNDADGKTLTAEDIRFFIVNSNDLEGLRSVAYALLDGMGRMQRSQMEYRTRVRDWTREVYDAAIRDATRMRAAQDASVSPAPSPPPITFVFERDALNVSLQAPAQTPSAGITVEYDAAGKVIGTSPKVI